MIPHRTKRYCVTVIEWLSHDIVLDADSAEGAEVQARALWADDVARERFRFRDSGIDGVEVWEEPS